VHLLFDPTAWLIVVGFSVLGSLGNLALYQVGKQGVDAIRRLFPVSNPSSGSGSNDSMTTTVLRDLQLL
jgi:hypothetical protein